MPVVGQKTPLTWLSQKHAPWNKDLRRVVSQVLDMGFFKKFAYENVTIAARQKWTPDNKPTLKPLNFDHLMLPTTFVLGIYLLLAIPTFLCELCFPNVIII